MGPSLMVPHSSEFQDQNRRMIFESFPSAIVEIEGYLELLKSAFYSIQQPANVSMDHH